MRGKESATGEFLRQKDAPKGGGAFKARSFSLMLSALLFCSFFAGNLYANTAPTIGGTFTTGGTVNDNATITPFANISVADAEADNVSVFIIYTGANGTLNGTGLTGSAGNYTVGPFSTITATSYLQELVFTPTENQVAEGNTVVTNFTLTPNDGTTDGTLDSTTQITATSINAPPVLGVNCEPQCFELKWGSLGSGNGELSAPNAIAVDGSDNVYVAESSNHRIQKFDSNGNFILKWGSYGSSNGQFNSPSGVAVDESGNVYVAEKNNHRIQKFDSNGNFILKWGSSGYDDGQFYNPRGIAVDSSGNVYVSSVHIIQKFDSNGNFIKKWGSIGSADGQFNSPSGIAVDGSSNIYVVDMSNNRIQKFDLNGNFIAKWGSYGFGDGNFISPYGIAVDNSGNVYVSGTYHDRIQKFDSTGNFLGKWGTEGSGDGQFFIPYGIGADDADSVFVADRNNHRIQKFSYFVSFLSVSTDEDSALTFTYSNFSTAFTDSEGSALTEIKITSLPTGTLELSSSAVTLDQVIARADIGNLTYTPDDDYNGSDSFGWNASDGAQYAAEDSTVEITVTSINDQPTLDAIADPAAIDEDAGQQIVFFTGVGRGAPYESDYLSLYITSSDTDLIPNPTYSYASPNTGGYMLYTPAANANGTAIITVTIRDNQSINNTVTQTFTVTVNAVNDAPELALPYRFSDSVGSNGTGDGQLKYAWGVAVDSSGNIYVADKGNNRIQKFDSDGNFIAKWGGLGSGDGQLNSPYCVAADESGNVYVADFGNNRIQKFDSDGNFIAKWGSYGSGDGQFNGPFSVAVDGSGNVYVAGLNNNRIQKFDSDGNFIAKWGSWGTSDGRFNGLYSVAADSSGNVYASDIHNFRIQKFDSNGNFITKWGSNGSADGQFKVAYGIAVDGSGNVYVADYSNHNIQQFDSGGNFITKWGSYGSGDGEFKNPSGVAADSLGNIYVADYGNHRIQKFLQPMNSIDKTVAEDNAFALSSSDFSYIFSDIEGDSLVEIKITSLPSGTLELDSSPVTLDQVIALAEIDNLTYTPYANFSGADSFGWNASEGSLYATIDSTVEITVTGVNDAPILEGAFTTNGTVDDNATTTPFSGVTVSDVDGDNVSVFITYTDANGTLSGTGLAGSAGSYTLSSTDTATQTSRLQALIFTPTPNQAPVGNTVVTSFDLIPHDGVTPGATYGSTQITVTSINDAPTFTGTPAISGAAIEGQTLSLTGTGTDDVDGDSVTLSYQWKSRVDNVGTNSASYVVSASDDGKAITCVITADDGQGEASSTATVTTGGVAALADDDLDGVANASDAFPTDPAASVDTDSDGYPDSWNAGKSSADSTTGLTTIDAFPTDPDGWTDADADGLPDEWETAAFGNISGGVISDTDGDGLTTLEEYRLGTDPQTDNAGLTDEDGDNVPDSWEVAFFGSTSVNPFDDADGDGITNIREYFHATDPTIDNGDTDQVADSDSDGIPDIVEEANGTDPDVADATSDADGDGLSNLEEYYLGSGANEDNQLMTNTDNDGIPDRVEIAAGLDPETDDSASYIDYMNGMLGMSTASFDGDTIPDLWEAANGLDPSSDNSATDSDSDGIPDVDEYAAGSNPMVNLPPASVEVTTTNGTVFGVADTVTIAFNVTTDPEGQDVTYSAKLYEGFDTGAEPLEIDDTVTSGGGYSPAYALAEDTIYTVVITASDGLVTSPVTTSSFVVSEGTIAGDSDYSGQVDGYDLILMSVCFGKNESDPGFNAFADLHRDGIIDGQDMAKLAPNFGQRRP